MIDVTVRKTERVLVETAFTPSVADLKRLCFSLVSRKDAETQRIQINDDRNSEKNGKSPCGDGVHAVGNRFKSFVFFIGRSQSRKDAKDPQQ